MSIVETISFKAWLEDPQEFARKLGENHKKTGFCGINDHPIPESLVNKSLEIFSEFFGRSEEFKMQYFKKDLGGARGYTPYKIETPKGGKHADLKEFWQVGRNLNEDHPYRQYMFNNVHVSEIEDFKRTVNELYKAFDEFGKELMKAIAIYLDLDKQYFNSYINDGNSVLRAIHYPPYEIESGERSGAHGDINLITLLIGGNKPGLEICIDEEWHPVETPQSTVVCNVGDMLERFTNHRLPSVIHRVNTPSDVSKNSSRFSIPFFLHPNPDWFIQTLGSCVDDDHPNKYPEGIMADDFLQQRLYEIKLL